MLNHIINFIINPLVRTSWRTVVSLWKPMAGWTILVYLVITALLVPVLMILVDMGFFRGELRIVGNDELVGWIMSPSGFSYILLILLITLIGLVIRFAGLFQIVADQLLGRKVSLRATLLRILPRIHLLVKLCAISVLGAVVLIIPLLLGLGLVYYIYLGEFDLNYYLLTSPPEWYSALIWGGSWSVIWLIMALITVACLLPALPAYLDGRKSVSDAIREVWDAPMKETFRLIKSVSVAAGLWVLFRLISDSVLFYTYINIAGWVHSYTDSLRIMAVVAGNYLFLTIFIGTIISFFGFSLISVIITKFYYQHTAPSMEFEIPGLVKLTRKTVRIFVWWTKPLRALIMIVLILIGSLSASLLLADFRMEERNILNIAHRANALGAPENSLAALHNSIEVGADMVEIDVKMTTDRRVVLMHDADMMRVAGDNRSVTDVSYSDLQNLRLLTDQEYADSLLVIPTLEQFIEHANGKISLLIELKYYGYYPELAEEVVQIIRNYAIEGEVLVMSMSARAVMQMREIAPEIAMGYTVAIDAGDLRGMPVHFYAMNHLNITSGFVNDADQQGRPVYAWTVNSADHMLSALQRGASGLITDEPVIAGEIIDEVNQLTRAERLLLQFGLPMIERRK